MCRPSATSATSRSSPPATMLTENYELESQLYKEIVRERGKEFERKREILKFCSDIIEDNRELWGEKRKKMTKSESENQ